MSIRLLGTMQVTVGGRLVPPSAWRLRKARSLVALLALTPGGRLHRERVLETLWPELTPAAAANNLRQALHAARGALGGGHAQPGPWLRLEGAIVVLGPADRLAVDVVRFEAALAAARRGDDPAAAWSALSEYADEFLADDPYADWAIDRRDSLRARVLTTLVELADRLTARGEADAAVAALQRAIEIDPTHEPARCGLMRRYAAAGRREAALDEYRQLRAALAALGVEPEPPTKRLYTTVQAAAGAGADVPAATPSGNLPAPVTSFVGRRRELAEVGQLLGGGRLLTITGAGGCGKTRLAVEVARAVASAYPDGVWLVELAALTDPRLTPEAVATALGIREAPGRPPLETLTLALRDRQLLLVLDNCEHLGDACADLAAILLGACPALRILATSRMALDLPGETTWRIPSLALPASTPVGTDPPAIVDEPAPVQGMAPLAEAVYLFQERAAAARPGFAVTDANAAAVAEICRRLDGIPLAIELAAPWVRMLPVTEIAARLANDLSLLATDSRMAAARQRTLRATLEWSYALLDTPERVLLHRLAVFTSRFTLADAEVVCAGGGIDRAVVLPRLVRLVDLALVVAEPEAGRYRLLETVRTDALYRLAMSGEIEATQRRYVDYYRGLALAALPALWDSHPERERWFVLLDHERDNLRAAWDWAEGAGEIETCLWLDGALAPYFTDRGLIAEARRRLMTALARSAAETAPVRAWALLGAGLLARAVEDYAAATEWLEAALIAFRQLDDARGLAHTLVVLGATFAWQEHYTRAQPLLEEALGLCRVANDGPGIGVALSQLGLLRLFEGDGAGGGALLEESIPALRARGDLARVSHNVFMLGFVALTEGQPVKALGRFEDSLALARPRDDWWALEYIAEGLGCVAAACGEAALALRLAGAAEADRGRRDNHVSIHAYRRLRDDLLTPARAALSVAAQAAAWDAGTAPPLLAVLDEALAVLAAPPSGGAAAPQLGGAIILTERERAVAALVARGRANRQIAAELGIGERTVEEYLARVRRKLGVRSRAEVAAWAAVHGPPPPGQPI
ncbi:MAG: LuxR family transcriptional regulator [Chloroflexi bacterium]|nr:LuxR family transcriptional regulator [Chloroflexota bacterium]